MRGIVTYVVVVMLAGCGAPAQQLGETPVAHTKFRTGEPPPASWPDRANYIVIEQFDDMQVTQQAYRELGETERRPSAAPVTAPPVTSPPPEAPPSPSPPQPAPVTQAERDVLVKQRKPTRKPIVTVLGQPAPPPPNTILPRSIPRTVGPAATESTRTGTSSPPPPPSEPIAP